MTSMSEIIRLGYEKLMAELETSGESFAVYDRCISKGYVYVMKGGEAPRRVDLLALGRQVRMNAAQKRI